MDYICEVKLEDLASVTNSQYMCDKCGLPKSTNYGFYYRKCPCAGRYNPYFCKVCDATFSTMSSVLSHKVVHDLELNAHSFKAISLPARRKQFVQKRDLTKCTYTHRTKERERVRSKKSFKCDVCQISSDSPSKLSEHMRTHTGEKPFDCDVCEKSFTTSSSLTRHMRTHSSGEKPFKCNVCEKSFVIFDYLTKHIRTHTGEKPYKCNVCEKSFSANYNLVTHIRTHTGEKPFKCNVCEKSFSTSSNLAKHSFTHTGEKPFKCDTCKKSFAAPDYLTKHISTHLHINTHTSETFQA